MKECGYVHAGAEVHGNLLFALRRTPGRKAVRMSSLMNAKVCCEGSWKVVHLPSAHEFHIRLATCAVGFHAFLFCTGVQTE